MLLRFFSRKNSKCWTGTREQTNSRYNIIVCLLIQLIRSSKRRHRIIGKKHALWKKGATAPIKTNWTKRKKPIWLLSILRLDIIFLSCSTLYKLNIKRNCKKARTWNDRWPLNHSLWTAKHKLDFTLNRFSLRFIPYAFDFVYAIKNRKALPQCFHPTAREQS